LTCPLVGAVGALSHVTIKMRRGRHRRDAPADPMGMLDAEPTPNVYRELARMAALVVGPGGTVIAANAVVDALGRRWRDLLVDAANCPVAAVLATGLPRRDVAVRLLGEDGVRWWSASARPLISRDRADIAGVAVTLTPLSDAGSALVVADLEALAAAASLSLPAAVAVMASPWAPAR
jgi:hypothetical protein